VVRINKVYTRSGDDGTTGLVGGVRVSKASLRIETYGTVDELNAALGVTAVALRDSAAAEALAPIIARVQNELFNLGAELSTSDAERRVRSPQVSGADVSRLESEIDQLNEDLPELRSFVLPGGGAVSAQLHVARTTCRRAERLLVALAAEEPETVSDAALHYLNRLSDALFVFGRYAAAADGEDEPLWVPG
jgi:cob(I)alamin adenosyltransferase